MKIRKDPPFFSLYSHIREKNDSKLVSKWIATITVNNDKETVEGDMIKSKSG